LHRYIGGILQEHDCQPIITGGTEDHVHVLFALSRTQTAAEIIKEIKRSSTLWLKTKNKDLSDFAWQSGYGIFRLGFHRLEPSGITSWGRRSITVKFPFRMNFGNYCGGMK